MDHPGAHFPGWCIEGGCGRSIVEVNFEQKHGKAENGVLQCHTTLANQDSSSGIAHKHLQIPLITGHSQLMPCNPTPCPNFELKKKKKHLQISGTFQPLAICHQATQGHSFASLLPVMDLCTILLGSVLFSRFGSWPDLTLPKKWRKSSIDNKTSSSLNFTHLSFTSSNT